MSPAAPNPPGRGPLKSAALDPLCAEAAPPWGGRTEVPLALPGTAQVQRIWICIDGPRPHQIVHVQFCIGARVILALRGMPHIVHPVTAGEMLAAIAGCANRSGVCFEHLLRPEDASMDAALVLWLTREPRAPLSVRIEPA